MRMKCGLDRGERRVRFELEDREKVSILFSSGRCMKDGGERTTLLIWGNNSEVYLREVC